MNPLVPIAISAGGSLLSGLFGGSPDMPEVPDFVGQTKDRFNTERSKARTDAERRLDRTEEVSAAQGMGPSAQIQMRDSVFRQNNNMLDNLGAREQRALQEAQNREDTLEYQQKRQLRQEKKQRNQNRAQAISGVAGGVADYFTNKNLLEQISGGMQDQTQNPGGFNTDWMEGFDANPIRRFLAQ